MPVRDPVFGRMDPGLPDGRMLRITNLSYFLETIQVKWAGLSAGSHIH